MRSHHTNLGVSAALLLGISSASAATLISSEFVSVGLTATQDIDLTAASIVDWGYYGIDNSFFSRSTVDNDKASSGIGPVDVAPGALALATFMWSDLLPKFTMSFDGGSNPVSGTVGIGAGFGAWAPDEDNAATFTFSDLGAGTHVVRIYVGHSSNDRIFDMDYSVTASDGDLSGNTVSSAITEGDLHSTYEIVFSTDDPGADLSLQFNSTSGGTGSGWIGGYVVETAAAPSPFAVTEIIYDAETDMLTLTWTSKPTETYAVTFSKDLTGWEGDLNDSIAADAGETTTRTFDLSAAGLGDAGRVYFRVEK